MEPELGVLSTEEQAMIRRHREDTAKRQKAVAFRLKALQVAAQYEQWLQDNQLGDSFSTFMNEFGYQEENASVMHKVVGLLRQTATTE